ncbi:hypothetical protein [Persicobacter diffluens]|uniref:DUF5723 domain-containing protein n=1 Tax=Persicobacter diffluens TaxID=981 RepID=A0AAN4VZ68_9BACT|nr:hypothetical protein PEDI_33260 [Persicobacter diffluens]
MKVRLLLVHLFCVLAFAKTFAQQQDTVSLPTYPIQFSVVTPLSTDRINELDPEKTIHNFSFNMFLGKNGGVNGFEGSFLANYIYQDMYGVQMAPIMNYVNGQTQGVQMAGVFNASGDRLRGVQMSGVSSLAQGNVQGAQLSGAVNIAEKKVKGAQLSGAVNVGINEIKGLQMAGGVNVALSYMNGLQAAPINVAIAEMEGAQIGAINVNTGTLKGSQIGAINVGGKVQGSMVGVINVADSVKGIPFGVLNIVRHGYRSVAFESNEVWRGMLTYRMGSPVFYNIFTAGYMWDGNYQRYGLGYGIGTQFHISRKNHFFMELTATHINEDEGWTDQLNLMSRFHMGVDIRIAPWMTMSVGPAISLLTSHVDQGNLTDTQGYPAPALSVFPNWWSEQNGDLYMAVWGGLQASIRFGSFRKLDRSKY